MEYCMYKWNRQGLSIEYTWYVASLNKGNSCITVPGCTSLLINQYKNYPRSMNMFPLVKSYNYNHPQTLHSSCCDIR